eukprot:scaffold1928_cov381-Prasinococcus_capsulatus_cf.AAC.4
MSLHGCVVALRRKHMCLAASAACVALSLALALWVLALAPVGKAALQVVHLRRDAAKLASQRAAAEELRLSYTKLGEPRISSHSPTISCDPPPPMAKNTRRPQSTR